MSRPQPKSPALRVEEWGSGSPVVLVHSAGLSGRQWRRLTTRAVACGFRVIVPDLTGHGASAEWPEPRPFSFRTDVDGLIALLEGLGSPAHVVGHSYGGFIALQAAAAAARSFRSLAVFEPVAFGALDLSLDAEARAQVTRIDVRWGTTGEDRERWLRTFVDFWGGDGAWAALREEARADFRRIAWVVREGVTTLGVDTTPASVYRELDFPALLMTAERSPMAAGAVIRRLARTLPDARVVTIANAGHMAPLSHADEVNAVVLEFLAAVEARVTTRE